MQAGNVPPRETIIIDYLESPRPTFKQTELEKRIILRPHQAKSINGFHGHYNPPNLRCSTKIMDCICLRRSSNSFFAKVVDTSGIKATLLWLDPRLLKAECLASLVTNWKRHFTAGQNVALAIFVPCSAECKYAKDEYKLWKADASGPINVDKLTSPIWYPSLYREPSLLKEAAASLNPYDVFPLIQFPEIVTQIGESVLTRNASMLEERRTRTRNFIYIDKDHPDRAIIQFQQTLKALPKIGSSILQPVITPGGDPQSYLIDLLAGVLSDSYFYTPLGEVPIDSEVQLQGIIVLRKCS